MLLPAEAQPLRAAVLPHFTRPTYTRFVTLAAAAIPTTGRLIVLPQPKMLPSDHRVFDLVSIT